MPVKLGEGPDAVVNGECVICGETYVVSDWLAGIPGLRWAILRCVHPACRGNIRELVVSRGTFCENCSRLSATVLVLQKKLQDEMKEGTWHCDWCNAVFETAEECSRHCRSCPENQQHRALVNANEALKGWCDWRTRMLAKIGKPGLGLPEIEKVIDKAIGLPTHATLRPGTWLIDDWRCFMKNSLIEPLFREEQAHTGRRILIGLGWLLGRMALAVAAGTAMALAAIFCEKWKP